MDEKRGRPDRLLRRLDRLEKAPVIRKKLLKQAGYRELYPRDRRDALLLFAINQKMDIVGANEVLYDHEIEVLE